MAAQVFNKSEAHTQGRILLTSSVLVADHAAQICIPAERFPMETTLVKRPIPHVGIFADTCNQYKAARKIWGGNVNYQEIYRFACTGRRLIVANAYVVRDPRDRLQPGFFSFLRYQGYQLKEKELRFLWDGRCEGNWDVGLALDAAEMGSQLDVIALVAGDGDYIYLVEKLKAKSCHIIVMSVPCALSGGLRDAADEVISLDQPQFRYRNHGVSRDVTPLTVRPDENELTGTGPVKI